MKHWFKSLEQVVIEGEGVKIKKVLAAKAPIPQEASSAQDEVYEGLKVENLPKSMDFHPSVDRLN
jgi:hypothetical protein